MTHGLTASGPSSQAAGTIQGSLIVTGSGNEIHISAEAFACSPEARNYLRMLAVIAAPAAAADPALRGSATPVGPHLLRGYPHASHEAREFSGD